MQKPNLPRYILCQYTPLSSGKFDKIPLNPKTLKSHSVLDTSIYMTLEAAEALRANLGASYGIGYVLDAKDKYFCVDIDNCITTSNQWNEIALKAMGFFPTEYTEISHSGRGLHIIGRYEGEEPIHGCKKTALGLEIYTNARFIALTGTNAIGNAQSVCTEALKGFIESVGMGATVGTEQPSEWTAESVEGCNPPESNAELIEFMLSRKLTSNEVLNPNILPFRDLWEENIPVLAEKFPTQTLGEPYDRSSADAALAYRLHYFTGGNCERVQELMNLSKLKRDKWDASPNYLPRTILNTRGVKPNFFVYATQPKAQENSSKKNTDAQHEKGEFLDIAQQIAYFQGCTYVADIHQMLVPEGRTYKPEAFNAMYGGVSFQLDNLNQKTTRKAFEAFTLSQSYDFPKAHSTCFNPFLKFNEIVVENGSKNVNIYKDLHPLRALGDVQKFIKHVTNLLPDEEDRLILVSYMAALIQYKGVKFTWCVIIQGVEGNGKSFLNEVLAYCIGTDYVHSPKSSDLTGRFNGWMENKLLITVDDIYQSSWDMLEILKPMITNRRQEIERKGIDKITKEVFCNFILNTNHQDGIRKTANDRRFAPLFTAQQEREHIERDGMGGNYFPELFDWFNHRGGAAAINEYLSTFEIPDRYNPTTSCIRAPMTSSTKLAIEQSLDPIAQRILEWVGEGCMGFRKGWLSSTMVNRKLLEHNIKSSPKTLNKIIKNLGYIAHPGLHNGRTSRISTIDNARPILYVENNHEETLRFSPSKISDRYELDQK